jgi:integrase
MGVRVRYWKGSWWVFVNHRGRRKAKQIGDHETALKVAKAIRERIARGDLQLGSSTDETFKTYAAEWLKGSAGNLKASTIAFYTDNLRRHVYPLLGSRAIGSITRADCRELVATARGKGLRLNTVRGINRTLSVVLSQAVEDEKFRQPRAANGEAPAARRRIRAGDRAAECGRRGAPRRDR